MSDVKHIDIKEFRELGFLQEVNRLFFHPRGLALSVETNDDDPDAPETLAGIWDYRDDPEGIIFAEWKDSFPDAEAKAAAVEAEYNAHYEARIKLFGHPIQGVMQEPNE